jgi:two-component sensor histidine kinase
MDAVDEMLKVPSQRVRGEMMVAYLPRFQIWPIWKRRLVPLAFLLGFVTAFFILYPAIGGIAIILSFVPVAAMSWTMGMRAGIFAGSIAVVGNYALLTVANADAASILTRGVLSSVTLILLGGLAGWVSQLVEKLSFSTAQLEKDREVLRQEMIVREHKELELKTAIAEKEVLLREIHHRVKNNLQIIASLLSLQLNTIHSEPVVAQFRDSQNRIRAMSLIHERLYRSNDLARIDFGPYLRDLTGALLDGYQARGSEIGLSIETDDIQVSIDSAVTCGLLVNELVSNALKHAFPDGRRGTIAVEMRVINDMRFQLTVCDDGVGFPNEVNFYKTGSLGLQLVNSLTRQLGGTVGFHTQPGSKITICFPATNARQSTQKEYGQ